MNLGKALIQCGLTADTIVLPAIGAAFQGGYYVGRLTINGSIYAIVISPKATGETFGLLYRSTMTAFTGNTSTNDGILIRDNMVAVGIEQFPAQQWCRNLTIGGYTDWYLPTNDELELAYRNLKPTTATNVTTAGTNPSAIPPTTSNYTTTVPAQTSVTVFRTGQAQAFVSDYYASSTKGTTTTTFSLKRMTTGATYSEEFQYDHTMRAFRRVLIS